MLPDLNEDPGYSSLSHPLLLSPSAVHRKIWGFLTKVRNSWMGKEWGWVYVGVWALRPVTIVWFVGEENSEDWVWLWVCPK